MQKEKSFKANFCESIVAILVGIPALPRIRCTHPKGGGGLGSRVSTKYVHMRQIASIMTGSYTQNVCDCAYHALP